jgi:hypothetical protein
MDPNPYQAPATTVAFDEAPNTSDTRDGLLQDWERRRLWFNAILIALTLVLGILLDFAILEPRFWALAMQGAVYANVCFCAGPVATWHASRLGFNPRRPSTLFFWIGTGFSMLLTTVALVLNLLPWQD